MERGIKNEKWGLNKEKEKRIIVEVGVIGGKLFFKIGDRKLKENEFYLAIDKRKEAAQSAQNIASKEQKNSAALIADAKEMPLKNESVDEVIFTNVFGNSESFIQLNYSDVLKEAVRILKQGGKLIINETYTPENLPKEMSAKVGFFRGVKLADEDFFRKFGLEIESKTADLEEIGQYTRDVNLDRDAFQLILIKK